MKKIYKFGLIAFMSIIGLNTSAQESPFRWGADLGMNISNMSEKHHLGDMNARIGFRLGVTGEYSFTENWFLQSGLTFKTIGAHNKFHIPEIDGNLAYDQKHEIKRTLMYLEVPVRAAYKTQVAPATKIFFNAGPYFAVGIGGKTTTETWPVIDGQQMKEKEKANSFNDEGVKRFDFGLGFGAGVEYGSYIGTLNYDLGLVNIGRNGNTQKNRNFSISIGYRFDL